MRPEPRIFSLWNSNRSVTTRALYEAKGHPSIRKIRCLDQIWTNTELTNQTHLCFLLPLNPLHYWPSFKILQSKLAPLALPHATLFFLTLKTCSDSRLGIHLSLALKLFQRNISEKHWDHTSPKMPRWQSYDFLTWFLKFLQVNRQTLKIFRIN